MRSKQQALTSCLESPDYLVRYGSQLYGTATAESDTDERGFVVPPFEFLTGLCKFDQRVETKLVDRVVWSLARFVAMLIKGDPQAYEMLFAPESHILACTDVGAQIREARKLFVCLRFHRRILGYAESEWRKVRGVEMKPIKRTPTEDQVVEDIRRVFHPQKEEMDETIRILFLHHDRELVSSKRKLGAKRKAQIERYGFCTSSACHSIRLLGELAELLRTGELVFPRPNADFLLCVKQGKIPYKRLETEVKVLKEDIELAKESTVLPENSDLKAIEQMYHSIVARRLATDERMAEYAKQA